MRRSQPLGDFAADAQHLGFRQPFLPPPALVKGLALQQRHGEVGHAVILADLMDGDDVIVDQGRGGLRLAQEAAPGSRAGRQGRFQRLQRDLAMELQVFR